MDWHQYIERIPGVLQGKPVFRDMQITVESVLERLDEGATPQSVADAYPPLTEDHIKAAQSYARQVELNLEPQSIGNSFYDSVHGKLKPSMVCPHCQTRGKVRTRLVTRKAGVSGAKVAAAIFTLGLSLLAIGLSNTEDRTSAWCGECENSWEF